MIDQRETGERVVCSRLVRRALDSGYFVTVHDDYEGNGEDTVIRSNDYHTIMDAIATTDGDRLYFTRARIPNDPVPGDKPFVRVGWVMLVYGNAVDGSEVIADHTDNPAINALVSGV